MPALTIPLPATIEFLVTLLNTPSPTGYTVEAITVVEEAFAALNIPGLRIRRTLKGALSIFIPGNASDAPRGLTAHTDTLGLMVKDIKGSGRLKLTQLGGFAWNAVEFEGVTIRTASNQRYRGTVLLSNPSAHVNEALRKAERTQENMEVRIDARSSSAAETRALGIEVGDFIFLDPRVEVTESGFIRSRHLDDKAGVACVYGALAALQQGGLRPAQDTHIQIANYEEVGHGGSADWPEGLAELIAVDMGAIGDGQNSDEFSVSICIKDSSGPYHFGLTQRLRDLAQQYAIPYKADIYPMYGSDGSAYWRAGGAARVACLGPGIDASHGYERTHESGIAHTSHLLAQYLVAE
jgi:putative aminopeptidase FrvX